MKNIVITGASSGIGLASVRACLAEGMRVIATARRDEDLAMLRALGATAVRLELSEQASVEAAAAEIANACNGRLDALFNNAGYGLQVAMEDARWDALSHQLNSNVLGPVMLTNALLPLMPRGARLIFNSSVLGLLVTPLRGPYCMSKYALEAAGDAYRMELNSRDIAVHLIEPGPIEAHFRQNALARLRGCLGGRPTRLDYSTHLARLNGPGLTPGTLPAEAVAAVLLKILRGETKGPRHLVTRTARISAWAKRLLGSGFDRLAMRASPVREHRAPGDDRSAPH